jgi:long-chain acyl-CoA synthetase
VRTLADWLFTKDVDKNKTVLTTFSGEYCLADIEIGMHSIISMLEQDGTLRGKKVAILVPQISNFIEIVLGVNQLGGIVIPLGWQLRKEDLSAILEFLDPHIVFTIDEYNDFPFLDFVRSWASKTGKQTSVYSTRNGNHWVLERYSGQQRQLEMESMDIIACTSGSTGMPKGIMFSVEYVFDNRIKLGDSLKLTKGDRLFQNINASQIYGISLLFMGLKEQCLTIAPDTFDVLRIVNMIKNYKPTKISTTPSLFRNIYTIAKQMNALDGFNQLELCSVGGEMVPKNYANAFTNLQHCYFKSGYGSSETGYLMNSSTDIRESVEWEICPNVDFKLKDGELIFKVPSMFLGYYQRPDLTSELVDGEGWYQSGDLAEINSNNKITIIGRKKDLIKKGGQSLIPGEVEQLLLSHPTIKQAVVVGVPHPTLGEKVVAFIVIDLGVILQELKLYCSKKVAAYKVPDQFVVLDNIPTINGKADRVLLRKMAASQ